MESKNNKLKLLQNHLAFSKDANIKLTLLIDRDFFTEAVDFVLRNDNGIISETRITEFYLDAEYYCCDVFPKCTSAGLYFFEFRAGNGIVSEQLLVYNKKGGGKSTASVSEQSFNSDKSYFGDGIVYHVFVDRFRKAGKQQKRTDAVYFENWYEDEPEYAERQGEFVRNNSFFGGTIDGVTEKLDYIASLGATCIYLSPVFEAYSNHKYDTGDYMKVDEGFGGDRALANLIEKARHLGIGVILDCAFNHTGDDSIYFNKYGKYPSIGAYQSKKSKYYSWYSFIHYPDEYECWWGVKVLPRTVRTESFRRFICNKVLPKYLDMGIKGVRLDVADELEDDFLAQISKSVKEGHRERVVIGEVWEDASNKIAYGVRKRYFVDGELDGVTNYPLRDGIIDFLKTGNKQRLCDTVETLIAHYPPHCLQNSLNFLGSHDTERIITILGGESGEGKTGSELVGMRMSEFERESAKEMLKRAFLLLVTLPGMPCIYYGDEIGMEGYRDPFNRRPYPWGKEDNELLSFVKKLGSLRKNGTLSGEFEILECGNGCFACSVGCGKVICAVNMSDCDEYLNLDGEYADLLNGRKYDEIVKIAARGYVLLKNQKTRKKIK